MLTVLLSVTNHAYSSPTQWTQGSGANGHWYELINNGSFLNWNTANSYASSSQYNGITGHLATFTSAEENTWVYQNIIQPFLIGDYNVCVWLGGTMPYGGTWQWVTGETWSYENWYPGEPNNLASSPGAVDAIAIASVKGIFEAEDKMSDALVNWYSSTYPLQWYLVEYEDEISDVSVPEPSSIALLALGCVKLIGQIIRRK